MNDKAEKKVKKPTPADVLILTTLEELHRIGILSESEGQRIAGIFVAGCDAAGIPENEYAQLAVGCGGIFNEGIRKLLEMKMRAKTG